MPDAITMLAASAAFAIATTAVGDLIPKDTAVKNCINAYYADKFNGLRSGDPRETFLACMAVHYPKEFAAAKKKYTAPPATANLPQS